MTSLAFCFVSLWYKTSRFHFAQRMFSKCGKNISDTLGYRLVCHSFFLPHSGVICDLLQHRRTATWNLFFSQIIKTDLDQITFHKDVQDPTANIRKLPQVTSGDHDVSQISIIFPQFILSIGANSVAGNTLQCKLFSAFVHYRVYNIKSLARHGYDITVSCRTREQ